MRKNVLVVARELAIRAQIARALHSAGYAVELAADRRRVFKLIAGGNIDVAIVAMDAAPATAAVARDLRGAVARMIVLADAADEAVRSSALLPAADALLLQPLDEQELLARVAQVMALPQETGEEAVPAVFSFGGCRFDIAGHTFVKANGESVPLTRSEFELLTAFVRNPHRVLSRDYLRRAIVGRGAEPYDRSIDVLVGRLRRKIELFPKAPGFILTISGAGYKFTVTPRIVGNEEHPRDVEIKEPVKAAAPDRPGPDEQAANESGFSDALPHLEPQKRQLTVLCCGLARVLAAKLDLEDVGGVIRDFQEACGAAIARMGGSIARSTGEELVALFGYRQAHEDDAERAVQAGLDLLERIGELRSPAGDLLDVQIAIATGSVLMGGEHRLIGEPLLIAARLRITAPLNAVIVAGSTRKLLGGVFDCIELSSQGASEPVAAYRVTGRRAAKSRFEAKRIDKPTPLVGRQHELQQLLALWERAKAGSGQIALVCGEAGIGKSRVCEALLERVTQEQHTPIRYQCSPHHSGSPFHPIIKQLEESAGLGREHLPDVKLEKLEAMLSQARGLLPVDIALYAALLSIPIQGRYPPLELTPQRQKDLQISALIRQILSLADQQPLVIKLADAHWIDSSTLELFDRIVSSISSARVLVLVSFRPEFFTHWLEQSHVNLYRLNRLGRDQTRAIVMDVARGRQLPNEICEQIIDRTDGVPLFVEELTKAMLESELLQATGNPDVTAGLVSHLDIPMTLADSLTARLDRLGSAKEIAQIGAAIGREFSYRLVAAVASIPDDALETALAQIAGPELIFVRGEPPDSTYTFKHALVRDAAYATLLRTKRQHLHERIAHALEDHFPEVVETQPELVAHHLAQAGLTERAINYLQKAARRTIEQSANAEAIAHLTRARQLLQSLADSPARACIALDLQIMLGQAMIASHGYAARETREAFSQSRMLINDLTGTSQKFAILYGMWACSYVGGAFLQQKAAAAEFLAEAERHRDTAALGVAHRAIGTTCVIAGELMAGLRHLEQARELYDSARHAHLRYQYGQDIGVAALCYQSWVLWHLGYVNRASEVADEAMRSAEQLHHPHTLVYAICHARIFMGLFQRQADNIQYWSELVISLSTEHGFSHWMNCGRIFQGWAAICDGDLDKGIKMLGAGIGAWRGTGSQLWLPTFLALEAEAYAKAGYSDAALQTIDRALAVSEDTGECWAKPELLRNKANLLLTSGLTTPPEIEGLLTSGLAIARRQHERFFELRIACDLARIWQSQGRGSEALPLLRSVYDQFTEGFDRAELEQAKALIRNLTSGGDKEA
jgi:DNA-binding response OmpR family regulator/class 3 adenylate cyclase/predicted ATPase